MSIIYVAGGGDLWTLDPWNMDLWAVYRMYIMCPGGGVGGVV